VEVQRDGAKPEGLAARHVLLATGSRERLPPGLRVDKDVVQTSREAL
jgi:pyruvate/2-oxoglutarate dehydrogenase complex dihydrolipoamide dehydrogenase (E3) component